MVVKFSIYLNRRVFVMNYVDNNPEEIMAYVYFGSIVNNQSEMQ